MEVRARSFCKVGMFFTGDASAPPEVRRLSDV